MTTCGMHDPNDAFACDEKKVKCYYKLLFTFLQPFIVCVSAFTNYNISISVGNKGPKLSEAIVSLDDATSSHTSAEIGNGIKFFKQKKR